MGSSTALPQSAAGGISGGLTDVQFIEFEIGPDQKLDGSFLFGVGQAVPSGGGLVQSGAITKVEGDTLWIRLIDLDIDFDLTEHTVYCDYNGEIEKPDLAPGTVVTISPQGRAARDVLMGPLVYELQSLKPELVKYACD